MKQVLHETLNGSTYLRPVILWTATSDVIISDCPNALVRCSDVSPRIQPTKYKCYIFYYRVKSEVKSIWLFLYHLGWVRYKSKDVFCSREWFLQVVTVKPRTVPISLKMCLNYWKYPLHADRDYSTCRLCYGAFTFILDPAVCTSSILYLGLFNNQTA